MDGWSCFENRVKETTGQYCEFTDLPEITRVIPSNNNNLIVEWSKEVTFPYLDEDDLWVVVRTDEKMGEFSDPLPFTMPAYNFVGQPLRFMTLKITGMNLYEKNDGPMIAVRYQNTAKIKDTVTPVPNDAKHNTWGFSFLTAKPWNLDTNEGEDVIHGMAISSNIFLATSIGLSAVTSCFTAKSIMPAVLILINQQKLFLMSVVETYEPLFRKFLFYSKYVFFENPWF